MGNKTKRRVHVDETFDKFCFFDIRYCKTSLKLFSIAAIAICKNGEW